MKLDQDSNNIVLNQHQKVDLFRVSSCWLNARSWNMRPRGFKLRIRVFAAAQPSVFAALLLLVLVEVDLLREDRYLVLFQTMTC